MALQTSGAISLNEIHIEAGGSSGTAVSINDADIRALIGKGSGAAMAFNEWYGASGALDSQTVTVGYQPASQYTSAVYGFDGWLWNKGSCSDGTSNIYAGGNIASLNWQASGNIQFGMHGIRANSGWTTMTVNGLNFPRAYGSYSTSGSGSGGKTFWNWSTSTNSYGTTVGATKTVTWS